MEDEEKRIILGQNEIRRGANLPAKEIQLAKDILIKNFAGFRVVAITDESKIRVIQDYKWPMSDRMFFRELFMAEHDIMGCAKSVIEEIERGQECT